jgi:replication initiator protein A
MIFNNINIINKGMMMMMFLLLFLYFSLETENAKIVVMLYFIRSLFFGARSDNLGEKPMVYTENKTKNATTRLANPTPSKQVALLEEDEESTDLLPQGAIRSEVNLLALPFFALSRKDAQKRMTTEYHTTVTRGEEKLDVSWIVSANPRYGYPRPFDRHVHRAIEQIVSEMKLPLQNPVRIGSLYRLAQLLNLKRSGKLYSEIKAAIQRIVTTSIESKGTYYDKGKRRWRETTFHLYDKVVFTGEELVNGELADDNYLWVDSWYLDNINARYVKPLDYTYYRSLHSSIASRLYELLGVKFYGLGKYPYIRYRYSTLCQLLPVTQYQRPSKAKEILKPAHDELISSKFLAKVEWQEIPNEKYDWYVFYWAGTRAREEIQRWSKQGVLPPPDDLQLGQSTATSTSPQADDDVNDDVVLTLQNFGISKKQAVKLAKEQEHEYILEKLELVQWFRETKSPLVAKNPAGFARRAIEEDYPAPPQYKSKKQQALEAEEKEREEQLRLNCALCEGTGYYKVAEDRMAACQHGGK